MKQPVHMVEGPAIQPSAALLSWIEKNAEGEAGKRRVFRLPVVVHFEDSGRLALGDAYVGTSEADRESALHLALDDTGLKTVLIDTLRPRVSRDQNATALWLEGYWGPLVRGGPDFALPSAGPKKWPFAVLRVGEAIDGKAAGTARAFVEGS